MFHWFWYRQFSWLFSPNEVGENVVLFGCFFFLASLLLHAYLKEELIVLDTNTDFFPNVPLPREIRKSVCTVPWTKNIWLLIFFILIFDWWPSWNGDHFLFYFFYVADQKLLWLPICKPNIKYYDFFYNFLSI